LISASNVPSSRFTAASMLCGSARSTAIWCLTDTDGVLRSKLITSAPAVTSRSATACPMPDAAPVTM